MRISSFIHLSLIAILTSGVGFCARDAYEGPDARLLVKQQGEPDSKYAKEATVYLNGAQGSAVTIDINTTNYWYIDKASFYSIPNWCEVSIPSCFSIGIFAGAVTGVVTDKTMTFTNKANNDHPFVQSFDLILRNNGNPNLTVKIHVVRNMMGQDLDLFDYDGNFIEKYKEDKIKATQYPFTPAFILFAGTGSGVGGEETRRFEVHTLRSWTLTVKPTGVNANEDVSLWLSVGLLDGTATATPDGNGLSISFSTDATGEVPVWLTLLANTSTRYPRTAKIEIVMDGGVGNISAKTLEIKQLTVSPYIVFEKDPGSPNFGDFSYSDYLLSVPALNPGNIPNDFEVWLVSESNRNWEAEITLGDDWVKAVTPTEANLTMGIDEVAETIKFTIAPNPSLTVPRTAEVTFSGGMVIQGSPVNDLIRVLTIEQPVKLLHFVTNVSGPYNFAASNGGFQVGITPSFTIEANHPWTIEAEGAGDHNMFTVSVMSDNPETVVRQQTIYVYPTIANETTNAYSATYIIKCNNIEQSRFTVTQDAFVPHCAITGGAPTVQFAGAGALWQAITFECNFAFSVPDIWWLEKSLVHNGGDSWTYNFRAVNNGNQSNLQSGRDDFLQIVADNPAYSSFNKSVSVSQDATWYLIANPTSFSFGSGSFPNTAPGAASLSLSGYIGSQQWIGSHVGVGLITYNLTVSFPTVCTLPSTFNVRPGQYLTIFTANWTITISVPNTDGSLNLTIPVKQN
ncbi:MAG: hypothetical protein LBC84_01895 [Prevotellaceae bacterium]|jgi:hypothetical protein|nr:hypothetical protein [Prevotellaceae bacterium]